MNDNFVWSVDTRGTCAGCRAPCFAWTKTLISFRPSHVKPATSLPPAHLRNLIRSSCTPEQHMSNYPKNTYATSFQKQSRKIQRAQTCKQTFRPLLMRNHIGTNRNWTVPLYFIRRIPVNVAG